MVSQALQTSASDRWFTPPDLLADIRAFYGGGDYYDPCPARLPGERIDSGLWQSWAGQRVYCNPPYGRVIGKWVTRAVTQPVAELILLVPARTDAAWFQPLWDYPILFLRGRLRFSGSASGAPFPSALVYRGERVPDFVRHFGHRGAIVQRCPTPPAAAALEGTRSQQGLSLLEAAGTPP